MRAEDHYNAAEDILDILARADCSPSHYIPNAIAAVAHAVLATSDIGGSATEIRRLHNAAKALKR
jgi:hypothetical protein